MYNLNRLGLAGLWLGLLSLAASQAPAAAAQITLAHNGKPAATIVMPANGTERMEQAAADLQTYVRKICGVELPIARDGKRVEGTGLYIGQCETTTATDLPDARLNPESYAIHVRDGNVYFTGRYPTPACFAVMSFIEDTLGVRWFAPGDAWEYVPAGKAGELQVDVADRVKVPDTSPRIWSGHNFAESWIRWNLRNKTVSGELIPRRQFQNNLYRVFPPSKYAKTHPEYYPLFKGKRWIPPSDSYRYWRPCESNPDVIRLTVEAARKYFDTHPDGDSFSLGMDDIAYMCDCPKCRALDAHPDSYEKREFSDRHYKFVNAVAREVARTHPDRYIGTLIYSIARKPPETVEKLEDNVFGFITEVSASWYNPETREQDHALTAEWAKRCKHLSRYDYFGLGTVTPRYYPHTMAEQMRFDKSLGMEGYYAELNTFLPHTAPMIWAFAKMEWDASLDIDTLLDEYFTRMFGTAAPTMARYFDLLERAWNNPPPGRTDWEHRNIFMQAQAISPEAVDQGVALLDAADAQAETPVVRQRIEVIRAALLYAGYAIKRYALSEDLIDNPVSNAEQADKALAQCQDLMHMCTEREPFWDFCMQRDDIFGENLRGLAAKNYLMIGKVANLERGGWIGALRLLDSYEKNRPDQLAQLKTQLTSSSHCRDSELLKAWFSVTSKKPANLLRDPGFEEGKLAVTREADKPGPRTSQAAWSIYSDGGRGVLSKESCKGRQGSTAACVVHGRSGSVFVQAVRDVKPGQRYLAFAWARTKWVGKDSRGFLAVRYQTPTGAWHPSNRFDGQVYAISQGDWQRLILLTTVPEGAGRLVFMIGAKNQSDDEPVLFDDTALYRLP